MTNIIQCPNCGLPILGVSPQMPSCPKCGCNVFSFQIYPYGTNTVIPKSMPARHGTAKKRFGKGKVFLLICCITLGLSFLGSLAYFVPTLSHSFISSTSTKEGVTIRDLPNYIQNLDLDKNESHFWLTGEFECPGQQRDTYYLYFYLYNASGSQIGTAIGSTDSEVSQGKSSAFFLIGTPLKISPTQTIDAKASGLFRAASNLSNYQFNYVSSNDVSAVSYGGYIGMEELLDLI